MFSGLNIPFLDAMHKITNTKLKDNTMFDAPFPYRQLNNRQIESLPFI